MTEQLIGDRFLGDGSGCWIDLATGASVLVVVRPIDEAWGSIERRLREESRARRSGCPRLVDFGRVSAREWFEARSTRRAAVPARTAGACRTAVNHVAGIAEVATAGVRHLRVASPGVGFGVMASAIATAARPLGFLTIRADARLDPALVHRLAHRHLIVLYRANANRAPVIRWVRQLSSVSPRAHLVVEIDDEEMCFLHVRPFPVAGWHQRVEAACFDARALMDDSRLEHAEALLAAVDAEAAVRRVKPPGVLGMTWVRLRSCQERVEEARLRLGAVSMEWGSCERDNASASRHSGITAVRARR